MNSSDQQLKRGIILPDTRVFIRIVCGSWGEVPQPKYLNFIICVCICIKCVYMHKFIFIIYNFDKVRNVLKGIFKYL